MSFIPSFITVGLFGYLAASRLFAVSALPNRSWLLAFAAFPLGFALVSLFLFFSFLIAGARGPSLCLSLVLLSTLYLALLKALEIKKGPSSLPSLALIFQKMADLKKQYLLNFNQGTPRERILFKLELAAFLILAVVFFHYWDYFWGQVTWNAFGGWDARYFWKLKARFFFRDPAQWQGMFSAIPGDWSHPDYPLMLPGAIASIWLFMGKETLLAPILISLLFSLSLAGLIFWYLASYVSKASACLASSFLMTVYMWRFWSTTLYADIPLTFFITAAGICFVLYVRSFFKTTALLFACGVFAGLSLWTKDEGLFFCVWLFLLLIKVLFKKESSRRLVYSCGIFLSALAVPLFATFIVKSFLGTTGGQYLGSGRSASDFLALIFGNPAKTQLIAAVFGVFAVNFKQWNGLWLIFALAALAGGKQAYQNGRWVFFALTLMLWAGYFVILHVTPYDLRFQIETALLRIMSHAMGLGLLFLSEAFAPLPEKQQANP